MHEKSCDCSQLFSCLGREYEYWWILGGIVYSLVTIQGIQL